MNNYILPNSFDSAKVSKVRTNLLKVIKSKKETRIMKGLLKVNVAKFTSKALPSTFETYSRVEKIQSLTTYIRPKATKSCSKEKLKETYRFFLKSYCNKLKIFPFSSERRSTIIQPRALELPKLRRPTKRLSMVMNNEKSTVPFILDKDLSKDQTECVLVTVEDEEKSDNVLVFDDESSESDMQLITHNFDSECEDSPISNKISEKAQSKSKSLFMKFD